MSIYFDYQSSKPVDARVIEAMIPYYRKEFGNPSSLHIEGDEAGRIVEECRESIADFIKAEPDEIVFTSGATESNNLAVIGFSLRNRAQGNTLSYRRLSTYQFTTSPSTWQKTVLKSQRYR